MLQVIQEIFPLIFVILLAFSLKKARMIQKEEASKVATFLGFDIVLPALSFSVFSTASLGAKDAFLPLIAIIYAVSSILLFYLLNKILRLKDKNIVFLAATGLNAGALYPFVELHYNSDVFSKFLLLDIGGTFILFTLTLWIASFLSGSKLNLKQKSFYKNLVVNPVMLAMLVGIVVNVLNIGVPDIVTETSEFIGAGFGFLVGFVVGVNFEIPTNIKIFLRVLSFYFVRLLLALAVSVVSIAILGITSQTKEAIFLILISPVAMITVVYAERHKLNSTLASQYVTISLFLCVVLLPGLVWVSERL